MQQAFTKVFPCDGTPFGAVRAAEAWLAANGYSVGRTQRGAPRGILKGDYDIQKWRNLRADDRAALDGALKGGRDQDVTVEIWTNQPDRT